MSKVAKQAEGAKKEVARPKKRRFIKTKITLLAAVGYGFASSCIDGYTAVQPETSKIASTCENSIPVACPALNGIMNGSSNVFNNSGNWIHASENSPKYVAVGANILKFGIKVFSAIPAGFGGLLAPMRAATGNIAINADTKAADDKEICRNSRRCSL
jgi:hypothetical protein